MLAPRVNRTARRFAAKAKQLPYRVTFSRPTPVVSLVGGHTFTSADTTPKNVPAFYRPATASEKEAAGRQISEASYMFFLPARVGSDLVDVDATCRAVVAANATMGTSSKTFQIHWIHRVGETEIQLLGSIEE